MNQSLSLNEFIVKSIKDKNFEEIYYIGEISDELSNKIFLYSKHSINLKNYKRFVKASEVRHIKKRHPNDLYLINDLYFIFNNFIDINLSQTKDRITGKPIISVVINTIVNNINIQCVEVKDSIRNELFLKTIFMKD